MQRPEHRDRSAAPVLRRAAGALACAVLLAGCPGPAAVKPAADNAPSAQRAELLSRRGDHAGSARLFEALAANAEGDARALALAHALHEWLLVPAMPDATRVEAELAAVPHIDPRGPAAVARGLASAELAIAASQPDRALAQLRALGEPPPPGAEAGVLLIRARAQFLAGRAFEGVRSLAAREQLLPPAERADSDRLLWETLRAAAARGASLSVPREADPVTAGWLELARIATQGRRNPYAQRAQLAAWAARYPSHPANGALLATMQNEATPNPQFPPQVALLLPLSGRLSDAGEAVRDGFLTAYYLQDAASRPRLRIYDASDNAAVAYQRAIADGAGFVIGPLGKENVQEVTRAADGTVPTLALNLLPEGEPLPGRFFQFALAPEDEARQVAGRLLAEGRRVGVALVPAGEWGTRVLTAFETALTAGGGSIVAARSFAGGTTDYSESIVAILGFEESQRRYRALSAAVGPLQFTPRRRDDLQFVFLAGQPVQGRLVRPQLKFHYAGDLPVYSISDIYDPNPIANLDLEGVAFTDIPWMIADDPAIAELRNTVQQLWPGNARRRSRLFAMGFDAWRLISELKDAHGPIVEPLAGMTGRLTVDAGGRVRRGLDWAVVGSDGQVRPLPPPPPPL
ncbi:MAG TPA: penicillin-binding protein activator [Steroidobacteraceae bacterium]|nr:penicillin-binding protein activator [Steroidobacteraceae bacterium]